MRCREFVVVASLASYVADAALRQIMEDNRILRIIQELKASVREELDWLYGIGLGTWEVLAGLCGSLGERVRSDVLKAAHVSHGFMEMRIFSVAESLPYSLAEGNTDDNLMAFRANDEPTDPVASKIWRLLHMDFNTHAIRSALTLTREMPWSSASVEQQHASCAVVTRHHPGHGEESLKARALFHTLRHLLPGPTPQENSSNG